MFRNAVYKDFVFIDDNDRLHLKNIVNECLQSQNITNMEWPKFSHDLNLIVHEWECLADELHPVDYLLRVYWNFGENCLLSGVIFPKIKCII